MLVGAIVDTHVKANTNRRGVVFMSNTVHIIVFCLSVCKTVLRVTQDTSGRTVYETLSQHNTLRHNSVPCHNE